MTIKFRGYLKNNNQLKSVDESRLEKMAIGWIDYLFVFLIILYPLTKSLKLLISKYNGKILNVFLIDILGFIIIILLMIVHEYFHAITFSKKRRYLYLVSGVWNDNTLYRNKECKKSIFILYCYLIYLLHSHYRFL